MGRRKKWPPSLHLQKSSGQAYIRWNGRQIYLGPHGSKEAKDAYVREIVRLSGQRSTDEAEAPRGKEELVGGLLLRSLEHIEKTVQASEFKNYKSVAKRVADQFALLPVADFGVDQLRELQEDFIRLRWRRGVVNRQIVRIRTIWRVAEQLGHAPPGSWSHLRSLTPLRKNRLDVLPSRKLASISLPELVQILKTLSRVPYIGSHRPPVQSMLLLQYWSGMRSSEVRMMRGCEINTSGEIWVYTPATHKNAWREGHAPRQVLLGQKCQAVLKRWLQQRPMQSYLFTTDGATPYRDSAYGLAAARAAQRAGLAPFRPYQLRHAAKERVTRLHGLDAARAFLGQTSIGTTNMYAAGQDLVLAERVAQISG
jgi:integrase